MPPSTTTRVLLLRHAETAAPDRFHGAESDVPLGDRGRQQAEAAAPAIASLAPTALYCSPMLRARQTAEPILKACNLTPTIEEGLREIAYGSWEGRKEVEVAQSEPAAFDAWRHDPALVSPPGGESAYAIAARALPVIGRIRAAHPTGHVVVVSHKATIRVITCALLEIPLGRFRTHVSCPTTSVTTFELSDAGALLVGIADVHHLAGLV